MKVCPKCGIPKPLEEFAPSGQHLVYCRLCKQQYDRDYYSKNRKKITEAKVINIAMIRERNRKFVAEYLQSHPCVDCGEKDIIVLQFDHISDKTKEISNMIGQGYSLETIEKEITKCLVRCANCHTRKTAKDFNWFRL